MVQKSTPFFFEESQYFITSPSTFLLELNQICPEYGQFDTIFFKYMDPYLNKALYGQFLLQSDEN